MVDILAFVLLAGSGVIFVSSLFEEKQPTEKTELDEYLLEALKPRVAHLSEAGRTELITLVKILDKLDETEKK
jgi:hypothetical protein